MVWLCVLGPLLTQAQSQTYGSFADVQRELRERGISEADLYDGFRQKGVDPTRVNLNDPRQLVQLQPILDEIILELTPEDYVERFAADTDTIPSLSELDSLAMEEVDLDEMDIPDSLQVYGHSSLWNRDKAAIITSQGLAASEDYILGPGDQLQISSWGASSLDRSIQIDKDGYLSLKSPPLRVYCSGLRLREARTLVRKRLQSVYNFRDDEFAMQVVSARTIRVSLYGEVRRVGALTLPASNTVINALAAAGGPTEMGNLRSIKIVSGGETRTVDYYRFLRDPSYATDFYLAENAIIHIPAADKRVYIRGEVRRSMYYDLLPGEGILELADLAGGLLPSAYRSQISVERYENDAKVQVDINLRAPASVENEYRLVDGDYVDVPAIPELTENTIYLEGAVYKDGVYQLSRGMTLRMLLADAGLRSTARRDLAYIESMQSDGMSSYKRVSLEDLESSTDGQIALKPGDRIIVYGQERFTDQEEFTVYGAVRDSGTYRVDASGSLTVTDAIELSGGLTEAASGLVFLQRRNTGDARLTDYVRVDLSRIADGSVEDISIQGGDSIYVEDATLYFEGSYVEISGEVNAPGRFDYDQRMSIDDLVYLASGFTQRAARNRVDIYRVVIENGQPTRTIVKSLELDKGQMTDDQFRLDPFDQVVVRSVQNFSLQRMVRIEGEVAYPGPYGLIKENQRLSDLIQMAGGLSEEAFAGGATLERTFDSIGYVVMRLEDVLQKPGGRYDYLLKRGDVITIPKRKDLVEISGAVNAQELYPDKFINPGNSIKVPYHKYWTAKYYLREYAAGVADVGDKDLITVEHANGQIESVKKIFWIRSYPPVYEGSHINVGYEKPKPPREERDKQPVNWEKVVGQTLAQATAVLSLILLARELRKEE